MRLTRFGRYLRQSTALLQKVTRDNKGNVSVIFGLTSIPLAMIASMAVDYGSSVRTSNELQAAVDAGVLAAATALATGQDDISKTKVAEDTFYANLTDTTLSGFSARPLTDVDFPTMRVTMKVKATSTRLLNTLLTDHIDINVDATAIVDPGNPICMMSLNPHERESLYVNGTADILADGCSVHVNSDHDEALRQVGSGSATAESFCVYGDYVGSNYTPMPDNNCRPEEDPLATYFATSWATVDMSVACTEISDLNLFGGNGNGNNNGNGNGNGNVAATVEYLEPGIYCGDLNVGTGNTLILTGGTDRNVADHGTYIFVDGDLMVDSGGTLRNDIVGGDPAPPAGSFTWPSETVIVFAGTSPAGRLDVQGQGNMVVSAKSTGNFAGIAIAQVPGAIPNQDHLITGGGDVNINGIVYLPTQPLSIRGNGIIGDTADQFAIIADTIDVRGTGTLEIRIGANYQAAGLPELPEAHQRVRLVD